MRYGMRDFRIERSYSCGGWLKVRAFSRMLHVAHDGSLGLPYGFLDNLPGYFASTPCREILAIPLDQVSLM